MKIKKMISILLMSIMLAGLAGCGGGVGADNDVPASTDVSDEASGQQEKDNDILTETQNYETSVQEMQEDEQISSENAVDGSSDILVVYFSRTGEQYGVGEIDKGNTAIVAEIIIDKTGADSFEILPQDDYYPYTYAELTDVAKQEQNEDVRPAYAGEVPDLSGYSTIFIGAPVWWGDWPMICYTFFEENADGLKGKTLIPFSTHAGSGLSGFDQKLAGACPDSTIAEGLAISGTDAQNEQNSVRDTVNDWLSGLGF